MSKHSEQLHWTSRLFSENKWQDSDHGPPGHTRGSSETRCWGLNITSVQLSAVRCHVHSGVHRPTVSNSGPSAHRWWRASTHDRTVCTHSNSPAQRAKSQFASGYSQCSKCLCADGCKRIMASSAERARALESLSYLWRRYILSDSYAGCAPC